MRIFQEESINKKIQNKIKWTPNTNIKRVKTNNKLYN